MTAMSEQRLIVFTRYPEPGKTKTRLIPVLGPEGAADLQRRMTERVLANVVGLRSKRQMTLEIRYAGGSQAQMRAWLGADVLLTAQEAGPLDRRMLAAFEDAFAAGCRDVVIIGTDIPGITAAVVAGAFDRLREKDLVLGPATDGGYYLIGLRHSSLEQARLLLSDAIEWGTERVLQTTMAIAQQCSLSFSLLQRLQDIDRPEDLPVWESAVRKTSESDPAETISVIIPALDESEQIAATLLSLKDAEKVEVILVDGGSCDGTPDIARQQGVHVLQASRGKATQMNAGAATATGSILLFLHADTKLPPGFENHVRSIVRQPGVSAGAFALGIDSPLLSLRIMEWGANLRSRFSQMPFGDQGIFLLATVFREVGGFPAMPIMEDYEFIRRLKRKGRIVTAPVAAQTSSRRWLSMGIWRTWWINQLMVAGYYLGVSLERLAAFYRRAQGLG
jgi:rSAM/selenodomain-associated transferase 2/rSAM/selenodomain-associated transferase 1